MNAQMIEGLMGASGNLKLSAAPMSVYRQASIQSDTEKMQRALRYAGECGEKAAEYQEKLDEGIKAEREQEKLEKAEAENKPAANEPVEANAQSDVQTERPFENSSTIYTEAGEAVPLDESEPHHSWTA